ncbi:hypothetical protein PybrP1_011852 [[Pythium] brassicae (nom. inval.)]|nr:hypothetical protein PybrP1_011852 [[Pythium] brassicae (nom. inval.)]
MSATDTPESAAAPPLAQLKRACAEIRELLATLVDQRVRAKETGRTLDKAALRAQRWRLLVLLRGVKAGLRATFTAADDWKSRVARQKDVVEAHQLKLQNLLYEKDHLLREIRRCRGFSTKEMDKIEFEGGKLPIVGDAETHRQHLDQLTKELETRKRMITQLKDLKERIEKIDAATQAKQAFLDGLRHEVAAIENATTGLQLYMGAPVTAQLNRQHEANQLAAPLYTLFCELEAYQIASDSSKAMGLSIVDAQPTTRTNKPGLHQKRSFPRALQNGGASASAALGDQDASSGQPAKRLKGPSRSPSVATASVAADAGHRAPPSRSPSVLRSKTQLALESGEVVATGVAEKLLALRPYDDESSASQQETPPVSTDLETLETVGGGTEDPAAADEDPSFQDLWKPSEKALLLSLSLAIEGESPEGTPAAAAFSLRFQYLPAARVVTAEVVKAQPAVAAPAHTLLMNLFPGDDGLALPRLACNYAFHEAAGAAQQELQFPSDAACRPYYWTQWICGLHPAKRLVLGDSDAGGAADAATAKRRPEPSVRSVMQQLVKRLVGSVHLTTQLGLLQRAAPATHVVFVHSTAAAQFPDAAKTQLESWQEIAPAPAHDVFQLFKDQAARAAFHLPTTGCRYFRVTFRSERAKMAAVVELSPEYPVRAPRFLFQPKTAASSSAESGQLSAYENQLKEIEVEVNAFYPELVTRASEHFLLMHQLRKVQLCFDMLSRALAGGSSATLCFGRERRGKDRRQAIVMDPVSKELRHR